jgi:hypothetical protein
MKKPKDKRTKEYKEWKEKFESEQSKKPSGLGDVIEKITVATGIKKAVEFLAGEDCGCDERKDKLNKIFHFDKPKCLLEDEYEYLIEFFAHRRTNVTFLQRQELYTIHNRVFGTHLKNSTCPSCVITLMKKLEAIIKTYR